MVSMLILFPYDAPLLVVVIGAVAWWARRRNPTLRRLKRLVRQDRKLLIRRITGND